MAQFLTQDQINSVYELYIGYFNRAPEAGGLNYWSNYYLGQVNAGKTDAAIQKDIANQFYSAAVQYNIYSAGTPVEDFIKASYLNALGRDSVDDAGMTYWTAKLNSGEVSRGEFVQKLISDAKGFASDATYGWVSDYLDNRMAVAKAFAAANTTTTGDAAITAGKAALSAVTPAAVQAGQTTTEALAAAAGFTSVAGNTFTLTAGIDTATANSFVANPVTNALGNINQTLNTGDKLTGTGTNPTLTVLDTNTVATAVTPTLTGIETLNYTNFAAAGPAVITGNNITGLKNVNVANSTQGLTLNALQTKVEKVGITNTGTATVVQVANAALAGTTDEVSVTLNKALNGSSLQLNAVSGSNGYETIKVNVTGENSVINAITTNTANTKTITFTGDKDLTVGASVGAGAAPLNASLTTIDASALTGKFVLGGVPTATSNLSAFATAAGAATGSVTITGTKSDDVITLSDLGQQYKIVGGDGADTLVITSAAGTAGVATVGAGAANITGIETLRVVDGNGSALAGNVTVNLLGTSGITALQLSNGTAGENANVVTLNNQNHAAGFAINAVGTGLTGAQIFNGVTYAPLGVTGTTDKVTVNVGNNGVSVGAGNNVTIGALTLTGIEQVAVNVKDLSSTSTLVTAANPFNAAGLTTFEFKVEGGNATAGSIALGNVGSAAVASAVIDSGAGVTAAIGNINAGGTSVVVGGAGNHTITLQGAGATVINGAAATGTLALTGNGGADTVIGGAGADTITGGAGADTMTGGLGTNTFRFAAAADVTAGTPDTITDFDASATNILSFNGAAAPGFALVGGNTISHFEGTVGTFAQTNNVVVVTTAVVGALTAANAATAIGNATGSYAIGDGVIFVVSNNTDSAVFKFTSAAADATVTAAELGAGPIITLTGVNTAELTATAAANFALSA